MCSSKRGPATPIWYVAASQGIVISSEAGAFPDAKSDDCLLVVCDSWVDETQECQERNWGQTGAAECVMRTGYGYRVP